MKTPKKPKLLTTTQAGDELGVTSRRIRRLCEQDRIKGAELMGRDWMIPAPVKVLPGPGRWPKLKVKKKA